MLALTLGNGHARARHFEDALSIEEIGLSTLRRVGESEHNILAMQSNLMTRMNGLDGTKRPHACGKTYTLEP